MVNDVSVPAWPCLSWKRASDVPSRPFVALSVLSCTCRRMVLHPFRRDGWNPPPRLKCTTSLKEESHHQSAHQMRCNKHSELSSTMVAVSVTRVFMTAPFSSMLRPIQQLSYHAER